MPTAIVATHSPVVVDAAKSLDEVALVEIEAGETKVRRVRDPERLAEKLRELGVTPSEALLYGLLETGRRGALEALAGSRVVVVVEDRYAKRALELAPWPPGPPLLHGAAPPGL
ncbi:hypothetical protein [Pyrodictium abyssi]|uniref:Uncharacterized protein n=1 Tax=Pyrodictium abyssi TaxID=54256 RepID=A0ABM8IVX5_9CREN|nr:hypothetical protein PABY_12860 [Pyrodictium abyssi]